MQKQDTLFKVGQLWLMTAMIILAMNEWFGAIVAFMMSMYVNYLRGKSKD